MRPGDLADVLAAIPSFSAPDLLEGIEHRDDAAVWRLSDDRALVATADFFTPVVDNPRDFGAIAAANALSDVYAMGGRPLFALNLLGFPFEELGMAVLGEVLAGGAAIAAEAGIPIAGGHTINSSEPTYGLAVIGEVHPERIWRNGGARVGDLLVLTKPLGSGVLTTAIKRLQASDAQNVEVTAVMSTLNKGACEAALPHSAHVHACTDVTGYGLLGHLKEMLSATPGIGARLDTPAIPVMAGVRALAASGVVPGGTRKNRAFVRDVVAGTPDELTLTVLADAQTSGGLLFAIDPEIAGEFVEDLTGSNAPAVAVIGEVVAADTPTIFI